jgi:hypothetical protein
VASVVTLVIAVFQVGLAYPDTVGTVAFPVLAEHLDILDLAYQAILVTAVTQEFQDIAALKGHLVFLDIQEFLGIQAQQVHLVSVAIQAFLDIPELLVQVAFLGTADIQEYLVTAVQLVEQELLDSAGILDILEFLDILVLAHHLRLPMTPAHQQTFILRCWRQHQDHLLAFTHQMPNSCTNQVLVNCKHLSLLPAMVFWLIAKPLQQVTQLMPEIMQCQLDL